jgi:hypothetical protein
MPKRNPSRARKRSEVHALMLFRMMRSRGDKGKEQRPLTRHRHQPYTDRL